MNRPQFVDRLFRYYAGLGFTGRIAVGDSSGPEAFARTRETARRFEGVLDIDHVGAAGLTIGPCLKRLVERATTPYAAVVPDDDFLVPAALDRCVAFLTEHPEYAAAHGEGVTVILDTNGLRGNVVYCARYPQTVSEAGRPSQRLLDHLAHYTVSLFSVHRIESWRVMLRDVDPLADVSFSAEVLPCCLSVVLGKIKALDGLYLVRQSHAARLELPTMFDWVATPVWYASYQTTLDTLAAALVEREDLSLEAARKVAREGFRQYVGRGLGLRRDWGRDAWAQNMARRAWALFQAVRPNPDARWTLPALLKPASPDYADFQPIYNALVSPAGEGAAEHMGH